MTVDVVALTQYEPRSEQVLAALHRADPSLRFDPEQAGAVLDVLGPDRRFVLSIEAASRIRVRGEARRLLGVDTEPLLPYWWLELRCPVNRPDAPTVAVTIANQLVTALGGQVVTG